MLTFDVRAMRSGSVVTSATVPPEDAVFEGLEIALDGPVRVEGSLQAAGQGTFRWQGRVSGAGRGECSRCLSPVTSRFDVPAEALFSASPDTADDPGVYPLVEPVSVIDLSEPVREEVALAVPAFPLCREECAGLCPHCGADLNLGPCGCAGSPA